jgi:uncharacterized protein with GYD domain
MATFLMFGKCSVQAMQEVSPGRAQMAVDLIKQLGGEVMAMYAMLGEADLLLVVDLPDIAAAMKVSLALTKMSGIAFTTCPAISVEEFDRLITQI